MPRTLKPTPAKKATTPPTEYAVPALEKGLDILEVLADAPEGLNLTELAGALDRKLSEIFRMADCLKRRGYVAAHPHTDKMTLSLRLFELAHKTPVTRRLVAEAVPVMTPLARAIGQSCHLAVLNPSEMLVIALANSQRQMEFSVRVGTRVGLLSSASGRIFLAFQSAAERERLLSYVPGGPLSPARRGREIKMLDALKARGFESAASDFIKGVINMSYPILDIHGAAIASLTVPYLVWEGQQTMASPEKTLESLAQASRLISSRTLAD